MKCKHWQRFAWGVLRRGTQEAGWPGPHTQFSTLPGILFLIVEGLIQMKLYRGSLAGQVRQAVDLTPQWLLDSLMCILPGPRLENSFCPFRAKPKGDTAYKATSRASLRGNHSITLLSFPQNVHASEKEGVSKAELRGAKKAHGWCDPSGMGVGAWAQEGGHTWIQSLALLSASCGAWYWTRLPSHRAAMKTEVIGSAY